MHLRKKGPLYDPKLIERHEFSFPDYIGKEFTLLCRGDFKGSKSQISEILTAFKF